VNILHLTLKRKWFELIESGVKKEEYREIKPFWSKRLMRNYDRIEFRNGYGKNIPSFTIELKEIRVGLGIVEHGAPENKEVFIVKLGKVISTSDGVKKEGQ
jgi:hypothetical protein